MNYENKSLSIIENSNLLAKEDFADIKKLGGELKNTFQNVQIFRTRTEMEVSVLNDLKHPTPDAKYWQAIREQNVMFGELVMLSYEYRKNQVQIKILEKKAKEEEDELKAELFQIEIEKKQFISLNQQRTAKDRIREILEWASIKAELAPHCKYSLTDVNEHQLASYTERFSRQATLMGDNGSPAERQNLLGQLQTAKRVGGEIETVNSLRQQPRQRLYNPQRPGNNGA